MNFEEWNFLIKWAELHFWLQFVLLFVWQWDCMQQRTESNTFKYGFTNLLIGLMSLMCDHCVYNVPMWGKWNEAAHVEFKLRTCRINFFFLFNSSLLRSLFFNILVNSLKGRLMKMPHTWCLSFSKHTSINLKKQIYKMCFLLLFLSEMTKTVEISGEGGPLGIHVVPFFSSLSGR